MAALTDVFYALLFRYPFLFDAPDADGHTNVCKICHASVHMDYIRCGLSIAEYNKTLLQTPSTEWPTDRPRTPVATDEEGDSYDRLSFTFHPACFTREMNKLCFLIKNK